MSHHFQSQEVFAETFKRIHRVAILLILTIAIGHYQPLSSVLLLSTLSALAWQVALAFLELRENWGFRLYTLKRLIKEKLKLGRPTGGSRKQFGPNAELEAQRNAFLEKMAQAEAELEAKREMERIERKEREEQEKLELRKKLELKTATEALKEGMEDLI